MTIGTNTSPLVGKTKGTKVTARLVKDRLDAEIIVGRDDVQPVRESLHDLVQDLRSTAERLGCAEQLEQVQQVLDAGASYQRQREVAAASGGDLTAVVDSLLVEFEQGAPSFLPARKPEEVQGESGAAGPAS